jgi:acetoin utilization protein AcuB
MRNRRLGLEVDTMKIRRWMKHPVHSVKPLDSIVRAREEMERLRVNQLPVVVDGSLAGIITDRDLRDAFPSVFDSPLFRRRPVKTETTDPHSVKVEMVMTRDVTTIEPDASMTDAARLMRKQRIGALPVVEGQRVVGILTRSDCLDALVDLAGIEDMRETGLVAGAEAPQAAQSAQPASRQRQRPTRGVQRSSSRR